MIIGLTGKRGVGKSEVAAYLERAGFIRAHTFAGGKAACVGYFMHLGATADEARSMVDGELKDKPSVLLPRNSTPRNFMERFGRFMGQDLGPEWTLGAEIDRLQRDHPGRFIVVESIVYEADLIHARGGSVIRVDRPGHSGPEGIETDRIQAAIAADATVTNDGSLPQLFARVDEAIASLRAHAERG